MHYKLEQLYKLDPKLIVTECSSIHTCNVLDDVISDLIKMHIAYNALSKEVLSLNPDYNAIGFGKIRTMQELAKLK